jgi:hypothetical protein
MATFSNQNTKKNEKNEHVNYCCNICDFITCKLTDYNRHLLTLKHLRNQKNEKNDKNIHVCEKCNKEYFNKSGLWRHKQKCVLNKDNNCQEDTLVKYLMNENKELKNMIIEVCKQIQPLNNSVNNNNNNTTHSNNKTFNLQFFLNETCKNAMNIKDFVDHVQLDLADLENVGKTGYIEGISNIIIKNLNALEMEKRPIHCADQKREVIYIKDEDKWEKEEANKPKMRKLIRQIAHKNICMFKDFREKYPDCDNSDSRKSDVFNKIVYEAMGGKGDDDDLKEDKIIHKVTKQVCIDKEHL